MYVGTLYYTKVEFRLHSSYARMGASTVHRGPKVHREEAAGKGKTDSAIASR